MRFEWDQAKNEQNIEKHGLDFADAPEAFRGPLLVGLDTREDYGEDRWIGIGTLQRRPIVVVLVFTERAPDIIRVIPLRKATRDEKERYEEAVKNGLETG
ncbi:MAG: BrnT family toxin [Acidobacteriota bacterium]